MLFQDPRLLEFRLLRPLDPLGTAFLSACESLAVPTDSQRIFYFFLPHLAADLLYPSLPSRNLAVSISTPKYRQPILRELTKLVISHFRHLLNINSHRALLSGFSHIASIVLCLLLLK